MFIDVVYLQNETDDHEATAEQEKSVEEMTEEVYINVMTFVVLPILYSFITVFLMALTLYNRFTAIIHVNRSTCVSGNSQLSSAGFCWTIVLMFICPC